MKPKFFLENRAYSKKDLAVVLEKNIYETQRILDVLYKINVIRYVDTDKEDIELDELLELQFVENLANLIKDRKCVFKFVGILQIEDICLCIYPKYITDYKDDVQNNFKKFRQVINVIVKYENSKSQNIAVDLEYYDNKNINLISTAIALIENFKYNGLYNNDKKVVNINDDGEILWSKTVNESLAYIVNEIPVYFDYYTEIIENDLKNFVRRVHAIILTKICKDFEVILSILGIEPILISDEELENFGEVDYLIYQLKQELNSQFITSKQYILKLLINYLKNISSADIVSDINFVGSTSFNLIWEEVCAVLEGNDLNRTLLDINAKNPKSDILNIKLKDLICSPIWKPNGMNISHETATLKPDLISVDLENKVFNIYDAKYYIISLDKNEVKNQPGVGDVIKQYLYQLAFEDFYVANKIKKVNNAFLVPANNQNFLKVIFGTVKMDMFKHVKTSVEISDIFIYKVDAQKAYEIYLDN
ncbi:LlaJI family restriction endonuclease [Clostridium perfringens]|uniref:LlaJI family restriction endonuclease n=1 Tax=Clostridium perfringens TaxID=1502 RepID=UPI001ABAB9B5|nr:LlaJI family restriction endonuclease [Clostridium perfringens]MBO3360789.1 LlaJI family restriction endonuclease [Clostridium perfringens]